MGVVAALLWSNPGTSAIEQPATRLLPDGAEPIRIGRTRVPCNVAGDRAQLVQVWTSYFNASVVFAGRLSAVEHVKHDADVPVNFVVYGVGKSLREKPVKPVDLCVHTSVDLQRVDVGKQGVEKVVADAFPLPGVELSPAIQVGECRREDLDLHSARLRNSRLAAAQSMGSSCPAS